MSDQANGVSVGSPLRSDTAAGAFKNTKPRVASAKGKNDPIELAQFDGAFFQHVALEWRDRKLTYRQLDNQANRLARCLIDQGMTPGSIVVPMIEDRVQIVVALLGILRAGCVYAPLDPETPTDRLRKMIANLKPDCYLVEPGYRGRALEVSTASLTGEVSDSSEAPQLIVVDDALSSYGTEPVSVPLDPNAMCYVFYTSGSTGEPKGIAGRVKGLHHFINWEQEAFGVSDGCRSAQFTSPYFDAFLRDVLVPLSAGGTVCIPPEAPMLLGAERLVEWIDQQGIQLIHCVPSLFGAVISAEIDGSRFRSLRHILMAGEVLPVPNVKRWMEIFGNRIQLVNLYGATETTMVKFFHEVQLSDVERDFIPIGKPMPGARALVMDDAGNVCPAGMTGELYVRTPYRSLGYVNDPQRTDEVFIPNPFGNDPNDLIYKSGDLVRLLEDGNLQFIGRKDTQVKVRGNRVELGEIENVLLAHEHVQATAVAAHGSPPDGPRLVAYVVAGGDFEVNTDVLVRYLKDKLPDYMIPSAFVELERLPLTTTGKVDRQALPDPGHSRPKLETTWVGPRNEVEQCIADVWVEVLGVDRVGVHDNFFDLGGHSLMAVSLFAKLDKVTGKRLPLTKLFESPTVAELAEQYSREENPDTWSSLVAMKTAGSKPPFFCIHPLGGYALYYRDLANCLDDDQPFYAFQSKGLDGKSAKVRSMEEVASQYIEEMKSVQPQGPYYLGGLCFGGVAAYEMACQLHGQGEEVALVALFDTWSPTYKRRVQAEMGRLEIVVGGTIRRIYIEVDTLRLLGFRRAIPHLWAKACTTGRLIRRAFRRAYNFLRHPVHRNLEKVKTDNRRVLRSFDPRPYSGRVMLFRASFEGRGHLDPQMGWGELLEQPLEIHDVDGHHSTIAIEPRAPYLAERIQQVLNEAQADGNRPEAVGNGQQMRRSSEGEPGVSIASR